MKQFKQCSFSRPVQNPIQLQNYFIERFTDKLSHIIIKTSSILPRGAGNTGYLKRMKRFMNLFELKSHYLKSALHYQKVELTSSLGRLVGAPSVSVFLCQLVKPTSWRGGW